MKQDYLTLILLIERLHRRFLDVIKTELERLGVEDVNNVQTLILYNIGDATLTVGELTHRGYYLGSNVSYNIKKLVESGFLVQERSSHDKRSIKVRLSDKGLGLCQKIDDLYLRNVEELVGYGMPAEELQQTVESLKKLEGYWSTTVNTIGAYQ